MNKFYLENRIWYVGYTWLNLEIDIATINDNLPSLGWGKSHVSIDYTSHLFNPYGSTDLLKVRFSNALLQGHFSNDFYEESQTALCFKFLKNGCVQIELLFQPKIGASFTERIARLDAEGAKTFDAYNDAILKFLLPLLQLLINTNVLVCSSNSLWGIPNLLSKSTNKLDYSRIKDFAIDEKTMHGNKTLFYSVLYIQHVISDEACDYNQFLTSNNKRCKEYESPVKFAITWGCKAWHHTNIEDIQEHLEVEAIHLSKIVIIAASINYNTELSLILLKDNELRDNASVDELRSPIALIRTHVAYTEISTQDFSEDAKQFYEIIEEHESKKMHERIRLQKESEDTLLQIANVSELTNNQTKADWFQFFLATISVLTIFSVMQDVASFVFIKEDDIPPAEILRTSLITIIFLLVILVIQRFMPSIKYLKKIFR